MRRTKKKWISLTEEQKRQIFIPPGVKPEKGIYEFKGDKFVKANFKIQ